jgi:hypothetical protein
LLKDFVKVVVLTDLYGASQRDELVMFWQDLYYRLHLSEIQYFLLSGQPSIIVQLMVINAIFMIVLILRRARTQRKSSHLTTTLQWIFLFANLGIICQSNISPYLPGLQRLHLTLSHFSNQAFTG